MAGNLFRDLFTAMGNRRKRRLRRPNMAECPNKTKNEAICTCTCKSCPNHSTCCECVKYHKENGGLPACLRK
jgi:hypothetical protein